MSALHYFFGEPHQGFVTGREAIAVADTAVRVVGQAYAGMNLWELGEHREAVDYFRAAIAALKDRLVHERFGQVLVIGVLARVGLAGTLAELGDFDEAIAVGEQGVEIAQAAEHATSVATAQWGLGLPHLLRGNIEKALPFLQDAVIACREMNLRTYFHWTAPTLGRAYLLAGKGDQALELMEAALQRRHRRGRGSAIGARAATAPPRQRYPKGRSSAQDET